MALLPGTRLGPYEIVAPLGAGGMGEVYRARDSRLGRDVAVKVLPEHLSANPEVRARFEREAKAVSSLNHPHICTLHDVGREGDTDYLVMELVEGESLAQRLERGALPAPDVLRLGAQIADALDRAHRAGVVHRDLKPGNVMLTRSGAKLMDFGLARATGLAGATGSGSMLATMTHSPTVAAPLTAEGSIVGTFQYMAPEQLEGKEADARADLWALGCVLYEMATGRRAFDGRSQASLISAIMSSEPAPASQLAPASPPALDHLIGRCLAKDADDRWQTARDLMHELRAISEGGSQSVARAQAVASRSGRTRLPWAIAGISAIAAAVLAFVVVSRNLVPSLPVQLSLTAPEHAQFPVFASMAAISPDGRSVAFCATDSSGQRGIWLRRLEAPEAALLAPTGSFAGVFWSPDNRAIGILDLGDGRLKTISVGGGTPTTLCAAPNGRGGAWNRDGVILFGPDAQSPLFRVAAGGGAPVQATWLDSTRHEAAHRFPCFLPDGEHFLFAALPPGPEGFEIYAGSLRSRDVRKIMTAGSAPTYAAPGYLLFQRGENLMAQRFDAGRLKLEGAAVAVAAAPPRSDLDAEWVVSASENGHLVFLSGNVPDTQLEWFDRTGARRGVLSLPAGKWGRPVLSPDDRFAAVPRGDDLWRVDLARSVAVRLTSNGASNSSPVWSHDGSKIAFTMGQRGREELMVMNSDGSGEARVLATNDDLFKTAEDWPRAGLVFSSIAGETFRDLWLAPEAGGGAPAPLVRTRFAEFGARVSPDGHWIAYQSNEAGDDDVYIQSFPVPGHKIRVSSRGAGRAWWMPGSDEICYRANSGEMMSVKLTRNGEDFEAGEPRILFQFPQGVQGTCLSRDGQRVLVNRASAGAVPRSLRVVLDWRGLLRK
ncbi:MAG: protein kinase [Candidatus Eisenbacteria bacterium]